MQMWHQMAIRVLTYHTNRGWTHEEMQAALRAIPPALHQQVLSYQDPADRQARLAGKLLLSKMLRISGTAHTLTDLRYTPDHKPYIEKCFDFNITHTQGLVACAAATAGRIGLDAELIRGVDITDYHDVFTPAEWNMLRLDTHEHTFWDLWTRKEALAKASGMGMKLDLSALDARESPVAVSGELFHLHKIDPGKNFSAYVAVSESDPDGRREININEVNTMELLTG